MIASLARPLFAAAALGASPVAMSAPIAMPIGQSLGLSGVPVSYGGGSGVPFRLLRGSSGAFSPLDSGDLIAFGESRYRFSFGEAAVTTLPEQIQTAWALAAIRFLRDPALYDWRMQKFQNESEMDIALAIFDDGDDNDYRWSFFRQIVSCDVPENREAALSFLRRLLAEGSAPSRAAAVAALGGSCIEGVHDLLARHLMIERNPLVRSAIGAHLHTDAADAVVSS